MDQPVSRLQDFRIKTNVYNSMFSAFERATKTKSEWRSVIEAMSRYPMNDEFGEAIAKYRNDLTQLMVGFEKRYVAFKKYADDQRQLIAARPNAETIRQVVDTLEKLRGYGNQPFNKTYKDNRSYNSLRYTYDLVATLLRSLSGQVSELQKTFARYEPLDAKMNGEGTDAVLSKFLEELRNNADTSANEVQTFGSSHTSRTDLISTKYVKKLSTGDIDETIGVLREQLNKFAQMPPFDGSKSSIDDYIGFIDTPPVAWQMPSESVMSPNDIPWRTLLQLSVFHQRIGGPYRKAAETTVKDIEAMIARLPSGPSKPNAEEAAKSEERKKQLGELRDLINRMLSNIDIMMLSQKKPTELDTIVGFLDTHVDLMLLAAGKGPNASLPNGMSASSWASSSAALGVKAPGSGSGFMYRSLDTRRLVMYTNELSSFKSLLESDNLRDRVDNLCAHLINACKEMDEAWDKLVASATDEVTLSQRKQSMRRAKASAFMEFGKSVRRTVRGYYNMNFEFVMRHFRDAFQFMAYWNSMIDPDDTSVDKAIREQMGRFNETARTIPDNVVGDAMGDVANKVRETYKTLVSAPSQIMFDDEQMAKVDDMFMHLGLWLGETTEDIRRMYYSNGTLSGMESLADPVFLLMYGLKLLRMGAATYALHVAGNVFQDMYDTEVYDKMGDPPSPFVFVGIFLGIDLAVNACIFAILALLKSTMKAGNDGFPIDGFFLRSWALDYVAVTVVVAVLASIIGYVIRKKKYFRYKYEGDRGIRTMRQMVLYVYSVALCIPFFRLANG